MRFGCMCAMAGWLTASSVGHAAPAGARYAAISGVVLHDVTGAPIRRAVVTLSTADPPLLEAVTFSEPNGTFGFTSIPPGKYQLNVSLDGFQRVWFGAANPWRAPGTLRLAAGDIRYGITFRLRPLGSISGVVFDPDGDPVPNVQVRLLKSSWERRKPVYQGEAFANTDDRGRYHFPEVVPGRYVVEATPVNTLAMQMHPEAALGQDTPRTVLGGAQFYADASRLSAATPVEAAPGKDLDGIDFHLTTKAAATLRGRIALSDDVPPDAHGWVDVYPQDVGDGDFESRVAGIAGTSGPEFKFVVENLVAGAYAIDARITVAGRVYHDVERVELPAGGLDITMHPERAIDLAGRVDLEASERPSAPFQVTLVPAGFPPGRHPIAVETRPDGTFLAQNLTPGIWDIDAAPIPPGGFIKSMRLGDQDVLTEDMVIDAGTHDLLRIVISPRGAVVSGTVNVPQGVTRSARARVLLAPSGKYADVLSFYAEADADESGHFEFKGVTPSQYKLYAFEEMQPSAYDDPNFLKPFEPSAEAFEVAEGAQVERQIRLILTGTQPEQTQ